MLNDAAHHNSSFFNQHSNLYLQNSLPVLSACSFGQFCLLVLMVNIKLYEQATNIVSDEHCKIKDIYFERETESYTKQVADNRTTIRGVMALFGTTRSDSYSYRSKHCHCIYNLFLRLSQILLQLTR